MMMEDKNKCSLEFVVNEIKKICIKKNFSEGAVMCSLILFDIEDFLSEQSQPTAEISKSSAKHEIELINKIYNLIDDLKFLIEIETRYVLFPLPDIKKEAYEMGKSI